MESKTERVMRSDIIDASIHENLCISGECDIFIPEIIISGGQTGADTGGLAGAVDCGILTGGYAPKGWRTEDGTRPELGTVYGLIESISAKYDERTYENIDMTDAIICISYDFKSPGSRLTCDYARQMSKPLFQVTFPRLPSLTDTFILNDVKSWLIDHTPAVLMIAGNRESKAKGIEAWTRKFVCDLFS